jgi:hypothetical protein
MKEYPGVRKSIATYKNWKEKCTHFASTHFWEIYFASTYVWEKYVTNLLPAPMWSKEKLIAWTTEEIYTDKFGIMQGKLKKDRSRITPVQDMIFPRLLKTWGESRNLSFRSSPSPWTSVNSADFLRINCAHEVRVWQVQIQANISLPEYPVMSLQERLLIIFDINFLLKLRRCFMNKALSNVTYLSSAAKVHSREMTVGRMVRQFWPLHLRILWETIFCWTKRVIPTVRENHDNLLCTQAVFNL